jgi:ceramide glucosyltransferase
MSILAGMLLGLALLGSVIAVIELIALRGLRQRKFDAPVRWPGISVLKPMAGLDDELRENLLSHLAIDYPGEWEVLLGLRSTQDPAYNLARAFVMEHAPRVKLVLQEGEPGFNPKVNQLITLTQKARFEVLAGTDSNVRVHPEILREHAAMLAPVQVGISSHMFVGSGEETLWAAFDNMMLCCFVAPNVAMGMRMNMPQIVGKSYAVKRKALEAAGGWEAVKDLLAEDQRLGAMLGVAGYTAEIGANPVHNIQKTTLAATFFGRHARWAMIRSRILIPAVYLEVLLNPFALAVLAVLCAPQVSFTWWALLGSAVFSIVHTQACAWVGRGCLFAWKHALLIPLRDVIFFAVWIRGLTMKVVSWRGNRFAVKKETRLEPL